MNGDLLQYEIKTHKDKQCEVAEVLNINNSTLSQKIKGKSEFTRKEIKMLKDRYDLSPEKVIQIFFED